MCVLCMDAALGRLGDMTLLGQVNFFQWKRLLKEVHFCQTLAFEVEAFGEAMGGPAIHPVLQRT